MARRSGRRLGTLRALRIVLPIVATVAIVAPLAWLWQASRVPASYSVMDMGYLDYGGRAAPAPGAGGHMQGHMHDDRSESRLITDLIVDPA